MKNDNQIIQGSPEWIEARKSKIGGSEIFSLVHHYCRSELKDMGFDLTKEKPFRTVQELFLKVKFGADLSEINPVCSEFGNGMEGHIVYRLLDHLPSIKAERTTEFISEATFHNLASCSPDGYVEFVNDTYTLPDFDNTYEINSSWGRGMLELKTSNYFSGFDESGSRLQYIFQLCYNAMVANCRWGVLAIVTPKEKEFDQDFFKGQILEKVRSGNFMEVDQLYNINTYIYPELNVYRNLIIKALENFQNDLDKEGAYPRDDDDLSGIQREKKMLAQLAPDQYGTLELAAESELDYLLNNRMIAQGAMLDAEKEMRNCENVLISQTKKYCEITGTTNRMIWTKNGQVRFYKLNRK